MLLTMRHTACPNKMECGRRGNAEWHTGLSTEKTFECQDVGNIRSSASAECTVIGCPARLCDQFCIKGADSSFLQLGESLHVVVAI